MPAVALVLVVLAFFMPGYFLNATLPLQLADTAENENVELNFRDKKYRFPFVLVFLLAFVVLVLQTCADTFFPKELRELAERREVLLLEIRPVLLAYKEENDCYPDSLRELLPDYTEAIPNDIDPEVDWGSRLYAINYYSDNCEARFNWRLCNGPDCGSQYFVEKDEFWHDM